MELEKETETRQEAARSRDLAQRIVRELAPRRVQVLGGSGTLENALRKAGAALVSEQEAPELLVV